MKRIATSVLLVLALLETPALAQFGRGGGFGGASTAPGDYLRGIGIEAWGQGLYNLNTAQATSILVDADIRLESYLGAVFQAEREQYKKLLDQRIAKEKRDYETIKERIRDHPETLDVFKGTALNAAFEQLNDPSIQEASRRTAPVPIPREMIRRIPFKLDQKNLEFSLQRLTARGKGKWPVALQQDNYALDRKYYEAAIDKALDQMIDGKVDKQTIETYKNVVSDMTNKLEREYDGRAEDRLYREAKTRLREMGGATELMKAQKLQSVLLDIDRYKGKTVDDLRDFMHRHNLKFAAVSDDSADERQAYNELYEAVDQMRVLVVGPPKGRDR
jgi:hypothetical protein